MRREVEPGGGTGLVAQRETPLGAAELAHVVAQPRELPGRGVVGGKTLAQRLERRRGEPREEAAEGGVDIGDAAIGRQDQMRVGRGLERLAQEIDPAAQRAMHLAAEHGGHAEHAGQPHQRRRQQPRPAALDILEERDHQQQRRQAGADDRHPPQPAHPAGRAIDLVAGWRGLARRAARRGQGKCLLGRAVHRRHPTTFGCAGCSLPLRRKT